MPTFIRKWIINDILPSILPASSASLLMPATTNLLLVPNQYQAAVWPQTEEVSRHSVLCQSLKWTLWSLQRGSDSEFEWFRNLSNYIHLTVTADWIAQSSPAQFQRCRAARAFSAMIYCKKSPRSVTAPQKFYICRSLDNWVSSPWQSHQKRISRQSATEPAQLQ